MRPYWKLKDDLVFNRPDITGGIICDPIATRLHSWLSTIPVHLKRC